MDAIFSQTNMTTAGIAMLVGYALFRLALYFLPRKLMNEHQQQKEIVIAKAQQRRAAIIEEGRKRAEENMAVTREEFEADLKMAEEDLKVTEQEISSQEKFASQNESRIDKLANAVEAHQKKLTQLQEEVVRIQTEQERAKDELHRRLETIAETKSETVKQQIYDSAVTERQLEAQKRMKDLSDELSNNAKKFADRSLSRVLNRYSPSFVWPKSSTGVELQDARIVEQLQLPETTIIQELHELTEGVEISIEHATREGEFSHVKIAGGYGIYKEAARLTLEELLPKGHVYWSRNVAKTYAKHRAAIEQQALRLGRQAVKELRLDGMHDEILKMVGALNWRTSYRQNQFYHSLEVAKLAGILAHELHVDPQQAKRCGLLHDIGKSIDYRIEGSHAVISGDYADRFGETRLICDTVMSHHNDLVVETPLAYVLKSADTLSGARPGARVNLEEGYQTRLSAIEQSIRTFPGIVKVAIMNGAREVHIEVNHKKVRENEIDNLTKAIARKIEEEVAFPGQIKVLVTRRFEAVAVA